MGTVCCDLSSLYTSVTLPENVSISRSHRVFPLCVWFKMCFDICVDVVWYILLHFYSKTNQMHISNLFYFGTTLYMFRMVSPSIIRGLRLYIHHQVYVIQVPWLFANGNEMELHDIYRVTQKNGNFWKTQQKLKKSKKKKLLTEMEPLQLAF